MKKKIVVLGSTGSIGKATLEIIHKNKNEFKVELLSTNTNVKDLITQAKKFKVRNLIICDKTKFQISKKKYKKTNIKFYNSFSSISTILKNKKIDYSMISLVGIDGLYPSIEMVKYTKNIAIANKESIVCGWALLKKEFLKYNTNFIPVDSEHFSIYSIIKNFNNKLIDRIYLTASGGPFLNLPKSKFNNIKLEEALKHPNWSMGNKITIDSSTLMNKVFEVIEARNIFDTDLNKIKILTHPNSYVHAIVKFKNGLIKFLAHDTDMKIPIHNSIYKDRNIRIKTKNINLNYLNNLNFNPVDNKIFPVVNLLKNLPNYNSLYETILITINDYFVNKFLKKKIKYRDLIKLIIRFSKLKIFLKYRNQKLRNINQIYKIRKFTRLKLDSFSI